MKPSIEKLHKFLKLEVSRGYDDGAVVGGLVKMFSAWENEARIDQIPENVIRLVGDRLRDYSHLSPPARATVLNGLWRRIQNDVDTDAPPLLESRDRGVRLERREPQARPMPISQQKPRQESPPADNRSQSSKTPQAEPRDRVETSIPAEEGEPGADNLAESGFSSSIPVPQSEMTGLDAPLTVLPGVGVRYAKALSRLGLETLGDALYYFPRRYDDYSTLKPINRLWYGEEVTVIGTVKQVSVRNFHGGKSKLIEALVTDGSGTLRVSWFNQPWLVEKLDKQQVVLSGKVDQYLGRLVMNSPEWELLETKNLHTNRIVPVYSLTEQITQRWIRQTMHQIVGYWSVRVPDPIPEAIRSRANLLPLSTALQQVHFPDNQRRLEQARQRLGFDEIFALQIGILRQRSLVKQRQAKVFPVTSEWLAERFNQLPFALTNAQQRAVIDLQTDLGSGRPMNRLLQGDVGSGKTIVAALGVEMVARHGAQSVIMAPTAILAEQHYRNFSRYLTGEGGVLQPDQVRLLVGATPEAEKQQIIQGLQEGEVKVVIGTHAVIEPRVVFKDLQFIIIDEQHRFGVQQRGALREKGENAHVLVMTATPIPRSLALSIYGDLDLSIIDEMPPGRQEISTYLLEPGERERAFTLMRKEIKAGRQAFIIFPLVEESDKSESRAAVEEHQRLQEAVFPDLKLGLLHGRMSPDEKDQVMAGFRDGEYHILVSTSVVEVGVDIPNATVIVIEGANRFGLAQLHQFRGRVGRGSYPSYCLLIPDQGGAAENERLKAMVETTDGFKLAEKDLEQRGPGEFLGTRQSGFSPLRMASITDVKLIEKARYFAQELFQSDPLLERPEHQALAGMVEKFWASGKSDVS